MKPKVVNMASNLIKNVRARLIYILARIRQEADKLHFEDDGKFRGHRDQAFGHLTYAQHGEDLIVLNIFTMLGIQNPSYLDIGAHHPDFISNTALLYSRGSRGVNVEANPSLIGEFKRRRPRDQNLNVGVGASSGLLPFYFIDDFSGRNTFSKEVAEEFVRANPKFSISRVDQIPVVTINDIVAEHFDGKWPHFLTIDVEGLDFEILQSARFGENGPAVICTEVVSGADTDEASRMVTLLRRRGYAPYCRTLGNVIFVRNDCYARLTPW